MKGKIKNDTDYVREFKNGNIEGFNEIVRKYQKQIYRIIRRMVQNHEDADDLTQEVFIKVHSALLNFRDESNLFTWLYRIAVNYSLNHLKKRNLNLISLELITRHPVSNGKMADEKIDDEIRGKYILEAIDKLPPQQKAVFNLRYYEAMSYEDISKIMERTVGGVKANYFHAVKKIGDYLKSKSVTI